MILARLFGPNSEFELRTALDLLLDGVTDLTGTDPARGLEPRTLSFIDAPIDSRIPNTLEPLTRNGRPSSSSQAGIDKSNSFSS